VLKIDVFFNDTQIIYTDTPLEQLSKSLGLGRRPEL